MVWLPAFGKFFPIYSVFRELVRPIHPIDAGVYVMLVAGSNLKNPRNPILIGVRLDQGLTLVFSCFDALNGRLVRNEDETLAEIFYPVYCMVERLLAVYKIPSLRCWSFRLTNKAVVSRHVHPFLSRLNTIRYVHCLVCLELPSRRKWRQLRQPLTPCLNILLFISAGLVSLLGLELLLLGVDEPGLKGAIGTRIIHRVGSRSLFGG